MVCPTEGDVKATGDRASLCKEIRMKEPKEEHAMKYGLVLPLSGIEGDIEQLVEYAHIAEEEGWEGVFLEDYIIYTRYQDLNRSAPFKLCSL
jgi:hypothetical protein